MSLWDGVDGGSSCANTLCDDPIVLGSNVKADTGVFVSQVGDSATAEAFVLDTANAVATNGSRLLSLKNNGVRKFAVEHDGALEATAFKSYAFGRYFEFNVYGTAMRIKGNSSANTYLLVNNGSGGAKLEAAGAADGSLEIATSGNGELRLNSAVLVVPSLPGADPGLAGQVWNDAGVLKVSAGI